jgi:signal transduction histidine kinase
MAIHSFTRATTSANENLFGNYSGTVAAKTFRHTSFVRKAGRLLDQAFEAARKLTRRAAPADTYAVRHAEGVETLMRMARDLQDSQPSLAAELMMLACR